MNLTPITAAATARTAPAKGPLRRMITAVLDLLSSVWWGVFLLTLALIYMSVGSAVPPLRQYFELSEMAWFQTPVLNGLIALFVLSVVTVTLRRIPLNRYKVGVWMVHSGLVALSVGAVLYFGQKIEGDVLIPRRNVLITLPTGQTASIPALVNEPTVRVDSPAGQWHFAVQNIDPRYEPLNDIIKAELAKQGRTTLYKVDLGVVDPAGHQYTRVLLDGFDAEAQDNDSKGRAIKQIGRLRFDDALKTQLVESPVSEFYLRDSAALCVRMPGRLNAPWQQLPLTGKLPFYHECYDPAWGLLPADTLPDHRGPLDIPLPSPGDGVEMKITGYLPYADTGEFLRQRRTGEPADPANPFNNTATQPAGHTAYLVLRLGNDASTAPVTLVSNDPDRSTHETPSLTMALRWITSPAELATLTKPDEAMLRVKARKPDGSWSEQLIPLAATIGDGYQIPGTSYLVHLADLQPNFRITSGELAGQTRTMLLFQIGQVPASQPGTSQPAASQPAENSFVRALIIGHPGLTRDISPASGGDAGRLDPNIELEVTRIFGSTWTFVSGEGMPLSVVIRSPFGDVETRELKPNEKTSLPVGAAAVAVEPVLWIADAERVPVQIKLRKLREPLLRVQRAASLIRVEVSKGGWKTATWVPHVDQMHLSQESDPRIVHVNVPGVGPMELMYTRQPLALPQQLALADFIHKTGVGGQNSLDFISVLSVQDRATGQFLRGEQYKTHLNDPWWDGQYHYFQSQYDPRGLSNTVLLVANRSGIGIMAAGILLMIAGMLWAFYVKPLLQRAAVRKALAAKGLSAADLDRLKARHAMEGA